MFRESKRARISRSGLDYSKAVIIKDMDYLDSSIPALIDQDEYTELMKHLPQIVSEVLEYVNMYINCMKGTAPLHPKAFLRKYAFSSLPYFRDILGL